MQSPIKYIAFFALWKVSIDYILKKFKNKNKNPFLLQVEGGALLTSNALNSFT